MVCKMRSGHCPIPKHKARVGISDSSDCSCGVEGDFLGFESQAVISLSEILSEPQHPGFREIYRFLEDEHINI